MSTHSTGAEPAPNTHARRKADRIRRAVAHHEAGHFVAAHFLGRNTIGYMVTIAPWRESAGRCVSDGVDVDASDEERERMAIELFAGYAAQVRADPSHEKAARRAASDDDEKAAELLGAGREKGEVDVLRYRAASLMDEHWGAVVALADELLRRPTLEGEEASLVVRIADGETARHELAHYRAFRDLPATVTP